jgi:hypothetical protein
METLWSAFRAVADYTIGTVIVMVHLTIASRHA